MNVNFDRITKVAAEIASQLSIKRGPKISPASVAHEFFLNGNIGIELGPWPKPEQDRARRVCRCIDRRNPQRI